MTLQSPPLHTVTRQNRLSDQAYGELRHAITEGQIPAGARLVELELAKRLKVGRTPLHDALLRLAGDGLVESVPNAGFFVRQLTLEDVEMAYEIRRALEGLAVRLACQRGFSDLRLHAVEEACETHAEAIAARKPWETAHADFQFHQTILALASSPQLESTIRRSHMTFFTWSRSLPPEVYLRLNEAVVGEHRQLVEALRRRDAAAAEKVLEHHFLGARQQRLREFARYAKPADTLRKVRVLGAFAGGDSR